MTLKHVSGDLLQLAENNEFDVVIHGCNCFNTMGGGIAYQIAKNYPKAYDVDMKTVYGDIMKLGNFTYVDLGKFTIVNAYTQYGMSRGEDVFEYIAFELILKKLAYMYPGKRFGLPLIGCGLARGDKSRIISLLENFSKVVAKNNGSVTLVVFEQK